MLVIFLLLYACDGGNEIKNTETDFSGTTTSVPDPNEINLLLNASFEQGKEPWVSMVQQNPKDWRDFEISKTGFSGGYSAAMQMESSDQEVGGTRIWGVMQELPIEKVPRAISGYYYVEDWMKGTLNQYLQVVILLSIDGTSDANTELEFPHGYYTTQIAWVLGGIAEPPFRLLNRKFIFLDTDEPRLNEWTRFEIDIHSGLLHAWGIDAKTIKLSKVRIFFEARYDGFQVGSNPVAAKVYFDDLSLRGVPSNMR